MQVLSESRHDVVNADGVEVSSDDSARVLDVLPHHSSKQTRTSPGRGNDFQKSDDDFLCALPLTQRKKMRRRFKGERLNLIKCTQEVQALQKCWDSGRLLAGDRTTRKDTIKHANAWNYQGTMKLAMEAVGTVMSAISRTVTHAEHLTPAVVNWAYDLHLPFLKRDCRHHEYLLNARSMLHPTRWKLAGFDTYSSALHATSM